MFIASKQKRLKKRITQAATQLIVKRQTIVDHIEPITIDGKKYLVVIDPILCKKVKQGLYKC